LPSRKAGYPRIPGDPAPSAEYARTSRALGVCLVGNEPSAVTNYPQQSEQTSSLSRRRTSCAVASPILYRDQGRAPPPSPDVIGKQGRTYHVVMTMHGIPIPHYMGIAGAPHESPWRHRRSRSARATSRTPTACFSLPGKAQRHSGWNPGDTF